MHGKVGRETWAAIRDVQHLLEEILDSERSPEEVCRDCAELLAAGPRTAEAVCGWSRLRWRSCFLRPESSPHPTRPWPVQPPAELPQIPGYDVQALLGYGGMGVVYKAWDLRLNRPVAIKMLLAGAYASPEERERFLREAEAAAGLRHPNIVQVYDLGNHDGRPYFTLEFVEGGTLAEQLGGTPSRSAKPPCCWSRWLKPWRWRTRAGSFTAI